jgi:hypothetical protein
VACTVLDGRPVVVTGSERGTVRVWDLLAHASSTGAMPDSPRAIALTTSGDLVIGFDKDIALFRRQPFERPRTPEKEAGR